MLAYAAGEAVAFDTLYRRHKGGVYRYLLRQCGNAGSADELFQDIWMNAIRVRSTYKPTASVHDVAVHARAASPRRSLARAGPGVARLARRRRAPAGARGPRKDCPRGRDEPEARAGNLELAASLADALRALPPGQRDAFLLQQEGGLSLARSPRCRALGVETVKSRLRYAVARLRLELADS
jgi:RNA polymerase sigma-70 factor (ECF subfamily)